MARRDDDSENWGGRREGAGRKPPTVKKKTTSVCLPLNIREIAQALAQKRDISLSLLVEQALRDYLKKMTDGGMEE